MIEGTDGSGKATQTRLLIDRLRREGRKVAEFDFPQYSSPSSYFVQQYLNGEYGALKEIGPHKASLFYALDRFDVGPQIRKAIDSGAVVVSNRYMTTNMAHQGGKISSKSARLTFFKWLHDLEYGILGIPKLDAALILHVPARVSQILVDKKNKRKYLHGAKRDIHENDINHLKHAEKVYLEMAAMFPRDFKLIECVERGQIRSINDIHEHVWKEVKKILSA